MTRAPAARHSMRACAALESQIFPFWQGSVHCMMITFLLHPLSLSYWWKPINKGMTWFRALLCSMTLSRRICSTHTYMSTSCTYVHTVPTAALGHSDAYHVGFLRCASIKLPCYLEFAVSESPNVLGFTGGSIRTRLKFLCLHTDAIFSMKSSSLR